MFDRALAGSVNRHAKRLNMVAPYKVCHVMLSLQLWAACAMDALQLVSAFLKLTSAHSLCISDFGGVHELAPA